MPISAGDSSWMLVSTGLVMLMIPALGFFEAGLIRSKNSVSVIMQTFSGLAILSILWIVIGFQITYFWTGKTGRSYNTVNIIQLFTSMSIMHTIYTNIKIDTNKDNMKREWMREVTTLAEDEELLAYSVMEILMNEKISQETMAKDMDISLATLKGFLSARQNVQLINRMRMAQYCLMKNKQ